MMFLIFVLLIFNIVLSLYLTRISRIINDNVYDLKFYYQQSIADFDKDLWGD